MSFKSIGNEISSLLGQWVDEPSSREAIVCGAWTMVVGKAAERRSRAISFAEGCLAVEVCDRAWEQVFQEMEYDLVRRLNSTLGRRVVRSIEWCRPGRGDEAR